MKDSEKEGGLFRAEPWHRFADNWFVFRKKIQQQNLFQGTDSGDYTDQKSKQLQ